MSTGQDSGALGVAAVASSLLGYFFYLCTAFSAIMMVLISLVNDSGALKTLSHYPRPIIVRTVAMRDGQLTTASIKRHAGRRKSHPSEATVASSAKVMEKTLAVSTTKSERRLKSLARQGDYSVGRRYATALSPAYGSSFTNQFIAFGGAATAR
jgi:hypothetical protein